MAQQTIGDSCKAHGRRRRVPVRSVIALYVGLAVSGCSPPPPPIDIEEPPSGDAGAGTDGGASADGGEADGGTFDGGTPDASMPVADGGNATSDAGPFDAGPNPGCIPPSAVLSAAVGQTPLGSSPVLQGTTVTFSVGVTAGSSSVSSYTWSLLSAPTGSGTQIVNNGPTASLDAARAGTYIVGVVVNDSDGCMSTQATTSITVAAPPPACGATTDYIFALDEAGTLYQFVPSTLAFTSVGAIGCSAFEPSSTVNTMAVDGQNIAWVEYEDGNVYKVDTATLQCYPTGFNPASVANAGWGSSFVDDTAGSAAETFYIAVSNSLETINTTTLAVSNVAAFSGITLSATDVPELTGTSSAELYGFFPGTTWVLGNINRTTGVITGPIDLTIIGTTITTPGNWAFASWGNDFWFFVGGGTSTDVFHYSAATAMTTLATTSTAIIVGASVSPCASSG